MLGAQADSLRRGVRRSRRALTAMICAFLMLAEAEAAAAACGFPWTVTATSVAGGKAAISVCGIYTGCRPHNRQAAVIGNEIRVTYTQAEVPDCMCVIPIEEFRDTVLISATPGHYTVTVAVLNCGQPMTFGSTEFTLDASSVIPVLDT